MRNVFIAVGLGISVLVGVVSFIFVKQQTSFVQQWPAFWLHISAFLGICLVVLIDSFTKSKHTKNEIGSEIISTEIVLLIIGFLSLFCLINFPYVSVGDELRDSGLYAQQIATGQIKNLFSYGAYDGYGIIIPTIASLFYKFFGSSVLTYRFPAALVSIVEVWVLYVLLRKFTSKFLSVIGASILSVLPLHLFFARTQLVVAFNGMWACAILLATYMLFEENSWVNYIFLGTLLGFSAQFHATIRVFAILILLLTIMCKMIAIVQKKVHLWKTVGGVVVLGIFAVWSFGPLLFNSTIENFFHTGRFIYQQDIQNPQKVSSLQIVTIGQNYIQSLGAWVISPVGGDFFHADQPLVPILFIPLFIAGIIYGLFFIRKMFFIVLSGLLLTLPLFTSAITDAINTDQRWNTGLPIVAVFCTVGLVALLRLLKYQLLQKIVVGLVGIYIVFLGASFFMKQVPNIGRDVKDYMSMNIIYSIQDQIGTSLIHQRYCLIGSKNSIQNYDYLHYKEQYEYFLPTITMEMKSDDSLQDNMVYLYKGACADQTHKNVHEELKSCTNSLDYYCPINFHGELKIVYN